MFARPLTLFYIGCGMLGAVIAANGCGKGGYGEAGKKGNVQIERRNQFGKLDPEVRNFPGTPIAFRTPEIFMQDSPKEDPNKKAKTSRSTLEGRPMKLQSKDFLRDIAQPNINADEIRGGVLRAAVYPPELPNTPLFNSAFKGTFLVQYGIAQESETPTADQAAQAKQSHEVAALSMFIFDAKAPANLATMIATQLRGSGTLFDSKTEPLSALPMREAKFQTIPIVNDPSVKGEGAKECQMLKAAIRGTFFIGSGPGNVVQKTGQPGYFMAWLANVDKYRVLIVLRGTELIAKDSAALPLADAEALGKAMVGTLAYDEELLPPPPAKKAAAK